jgi:hypothetical protein
MNRRKSIGQGFLSRRSIQGQRRNETSSLQDTVRVVKRRRLLVDRSVPGTNQEALGTGLMGGGAKEKGQVDEVFVERGRHSLPFESPQETGRKVAGCLSSVVWHTFLQEEAERSKEHPTQPKVSQRGFLRRINDIRAVGKISKLWHLCPTSSAYLPGANHL